MIESIRQTLASELRRDPNVLILGEDVGRLGGVFRATKDLQAEFGEDRVVDMPLAEGVIIGSALGLALSGLRPVAELQFLGFGAQAFHQLSQQVARYRYRSQGRFSVPLTIRAPFGGLAKTPEMHADALESLYTHTPGLQVVVPGTAADAKGLLTTAIRSDDPVLFLEPIRGYRLIKDEVPEGDYQVPFGKVRVHREGSDVTLVAWSAAVHMADKAAEELASSGISAEVIDLRTLVPLDVEGLVRSVTKTGRCVVVQESPLTSGFGGEVAATVQEEAFFSLLAPIIRVAAPDTPYPVAAVEHFYVPSIERIKTAVEKVMKLS